MTIDRLREIVGHAAAIANKLPTSHSMFQSAYTQWYMFEAELTKAEKETVEPNCVLDYLVEIRDGLDTTIAKLVALEEAE